MEKKPILMTQAQYARHRGTSQQYVHKLAKAGVLVMRGRLVNVTASDAVLDDKPSEKQDGQQPASYAQARLADMVFRAKLRRLEFETKQGRLEGRPRPGRADLATGGIESAAEAAAPRRRLWLNDGSCIRLRREHPNHVWSYDFVSARTHDGRTLRILTLIDEYPRECLALRVERRLNSRDGIEALSDVMPWRGIPEHIRSDDNPEFVSQQLRVWLASLGTGPLYIEPGSPWENGYCESFNGRLHGECLNGEIFYSLKEAQIVIEQWRQLYNEVRPHAALGLRPPAPGAYSPVWKPVSKTQVVM